MNTAKLVIKDEVNCKFVGLDIDTRRKLVKALEYEIPGAKYSAAARLGRWNGKASFCTIGADTYINLLEVVLPIVTNSGYTVDIEDLRPEAENFEFTQVDENSYSYILWPDGHPLVGKPVVLREHQVKVINNYLQNPIGINLVPTAGGKTIITAVLSHKVEPYGRSIVIVPTKDLVTQTEEDYINLGLDVGVFYGDRREFDKTHTICTWQSLECLYKKSADNDLIDGIERLFVDVVCVMVDEVHRASASVLQKLLSGPLSGVPIRWGLTGTMPKNSHEQIAITACIGPLLGKVATHELQEQGILAKLHINVMQLLDGKYYTSTDFARENNWLTTDPSRILFVANHIKQVAESGNTLILVDRIATGELLNELLEGSVFVSGKMKSKDRKNEYKGIQNIDGKILIATSSVASTGISINRIFNLVLFECGKSFVKVIQSIGRGLRVAEDKDFVNVYDICSNLKFSARHLSERKKFYNEAGYPFTLSKIGYEKSTSVTEWLNIRRKISKE